MSTTNDMKEVPKLHSFCWVCGWRKGGPDSWDGKACKCDYIKKNEIARIACKAFQPRLVGDPCVYPSCACKGPSEVADYVLSLERGMPTREPTDAMLTAARDWSYAKYGQPIGNDAATGCWQAMFDAALTAGEQPTVSHAKDGG